MSKAKQVQTEQVLNPGQLTDTSAAKQVRNRISNQRGKTGAELIVTEQAEQVRNNIQDSSLTDNPRVPTSGAKPTQKSRGQVRTGTNTGTGAEVGKTPEKMAKGTGADDQSSTGKIIPISGAEKQVRTGRKPGTKDSVQRKRRYGGGITASVPPDEKQTIVRYNVELFNLGKLENPNDLDEVRERLATYFSISDRYQQVPTVAGMALALGIDRRTLWTWMEQKSGTIKNPAVLDTLKRVYNMITSQYEGLLTQGKIVPVAGFFLMQNNFGYKNQTDHVVVAQPAEEPDSGEIAARAGLLEDSHD